MRFFLRVRYENHAVYAFQNELARGVIKHLTRNGVEMKARLEATHSSQLERHEIEEQRAIRFGRQTDQFAARLWRVASKMCCRLVVLPQRPGP